MHLTPMCPFCGLPINSEKVEHGRGIHPCKKVESPAERKLRLWRENAINKWEQKIAELKPKLATTVEEENEQWERLEIPEEDRL